MFSRPIRNQDDIISTNDFFDVIAIDINISTPAENSMKPAELSYVEYFDTSFNLQKCKVPELKRIAKSKRLYVSGNKRTLIDRIHQHFIYEKNITTIQRVYRGALVRKSFRLRGPAFKDRTLCCNDTDFSTMDPIDEIPAFQFFSFYDSTRHIYGCDIVSLTTLLEKRGKLFNPYNREPFPITVQRDILTLSRLTTIITNHKPNIAPRIPTKQQRRHVSPRQGATTLSNLILGQSTNGAVPENIVVSNTGVNTGATTGVNTGANTGATTGVNTGATTGATTPRFIVNPLVTIDYPNYDGPAMMQRMHQMKQLSIDQRIQELFMEIDGLGNYTQAAWFTELAQREYLRFYRCLYDIWYYRAQLSFNTRSYICPLVDPFHIAMTIPNRFSDLSLSNLRDCCLTVMEHMIFSGVDTEFRTLGALHVLSALTIVSVNARTSMPWLYDSLIY